MTNTRDLPTFQFDLGPLRVSWASLFIGRFRYANRSLGGARAPLAEAVSLQQETEEPYRVGHAKAIRLWPSHVGIIFGWWGDPLIDDAIGERQALSVIVGGGTAGIANNLPVTSIYGAISPEELDDKLAKYENEYDDFQVIDLRDTAS